MKKFYLVFNIHKSVYSESGVLPEGRPYSVTLHNTYEAAKQRANLIAQGSSVGIILEPLEAHLIPLVPVKIEEF